MIQLFISAILVFSVSAFAQKDTSGCSAEGLAKNANTLKASGFVVNQRGIFQYKVIKHRMNGFSYWKPATAYRFEKESWVAYATCHSIFKQNLLGTQKFRLTRKTDRNTVDASVTIADFNLRGVMAEKIITLHYNDGNLSREVKLREEMDHVWTDRTTNGTGGTRVNLKVRISRDGKISAITLIEGKNTWTYGPDMGETQITVTLKDNNQVSDLVVNPEPTLQMCFGQSSLIQVKNRSSFIVNCRPANGSGAQLRQKNDQYSFESAFPSLLILSPYSGHNILYEMKQIKCD